jgi:hypothetical protein
VTASALDPLTARIIEFLSSIGIAVELATLTEDTFLPGLLVDQGRLLVDPRRLLYPGDLLHEAGHLAVVPPDVRPRLSGDGAAAGVDMGSLEPAVIPWSYAAARAIGIDPAVVFHPAGYRGKAAGLLRTFGYGVYPGAHLLEAAGMCVGPRHAAEAGVPPYPHMICWLRTSG